MYGIPKKMALRALERGDLFGVLIGREWEIDQGYFAGWISWAAMEDNMKRPRAIAAAGGVC